MEKQNKFNNNGKKKFFGKKPSGEEGERSEKKYNDRPFPCLTHLPGPVCKKMDGIWRSMIRWRNTNRYRKDIPIPLRGGGEGDNVYTTVKTKNGTIIRVPPVNQIWREMMDGPRPKKRVKNVRMPEPKTTGKKR